MIEVPYEELDENIVELVKAINSFPGIFTVGSCGGHEDPEEYQNKHGTFDIVFMIETEEQVPTRDAWLALEFLVYTFNNIFPRTGINVFLNAYSAPPHFNEPGNTITFRVGGEEDPNEIADLLLDQKGKLFSYTT